MPEAGRFYAAVLYSETGRRDCAAQCVAIPPPADGNGIRQGGCHEKTKNIRPYCTRYPVRAAGRRDVLLDDRHEAAGRRVCGVWRDPACIFRTIGAGACAAESRQVLQKSAGRFAGGVFRRPACDGSLHSGKCPDGRRSVCGLPDCAGRPGGGHAALRRPVRPAESGRGIPERASADGGDCDRRPGCG